MSRFRVWGGVVATAATVALCLSACGGTTVKTRTVIRTVTTDVAATVTQTIRLQSSTVPSTAAGPTSTTSTTPTTSATPTTSTTKQPTPFIGSATQRQLSARCVQAPPVAFQPTGRVSRQLALQALPRVTAIENDIVFAATRPQARSGGYSIQLDPLASAISNVDRLLEQALNTHNKVTATSVNQAVNLADAQARQLGLTDCLLTRA